MSTERERWFDGVYHDVMRALARAESDALSRHEMGLVRLLEALRRVVGEAMRAHRG